VPAPSAPNAELKLVAKLCVALVASTVSSTVSVGSVPVVLMFRPVVVEDDLGADFGFLK